MSRWNAHICKDGQYTYDLMIDVINDTTIFVQLPSVKIDVFGFPLIGSCSKHS